MLTALVLVGSKRRRDGAVTMCQNDDIGNSGKPVTEADSTRKLLTRATLEALVLLLRHRGLRIGDAVTLERSRITGDKLVL